MQRTQLLMLIAVAVLAILLVAGSRFLTAELPEYEGRIRVPYISYPVDVYFDGFGVPHVFAAQESDLMFAAGYLTARERLFQMSQTAAAARGELALFFGDDLVDSDIYLRTWRIPALARRLAEIMEPATRKLVEDFCRGVNARIDEIGNDLPLEFRLVGSRPLRWTVSDVTGYARLMAHDLQQSWKPEIIFGLVAEYYGSAKLAEIIPAEDDSAIAIAEREAGFPELDKVFAALWERERDLRALSGMDGAAIGSNSWVLAGTRTATGRALLANDPHLGYTQPAKWIEMHLKGGRFDVSGVCLPGIPLPIIGQNARCAWGYTNVMTDDIDFFVETIHSTDPDLYQSGDRWLPLEKITETIPLKNGRDTTVTVRLTHHGPVISDIHPQLRNGTRVVSMGWTGLWETHEMEAMVGLATMRNWDDFTRAVRMFSVPGQNMVYADVDGNIGWRPAVKVPRRVNGNSLVPRPGSDPRYDWQGAVPFEQLPFLYNPPEGAIITANNRSVAAEFPVYISNLWAAPSRAERIAELLDGIQKATVADFQRIQLDVTAPFSRDMAPYFVAAFAAEPAVTGNLLTALNLLQDWDGRENPGSPAALIFHEALNQFLRNLYGDEFALIGPRFLEAYLSQPFVPTRNVYRMVRHNNSGWFDDITTPDRVETRDDLLRKSLRAAVSRIARRYGEEPRHWAWGAAHTVTHPHPLGGIGLLNRIFHLNVGPYPSGGSMNTINNGEYRLHEPYRQIVGPSMRRIVDFSNLNATRMILPTGQSGQPDNPHYRDQAPLYQRGRYRTTRFDEAYIRSSPEFRHLILVPAG